MLKTLFFVPVIFVALLVTSCSSKEKRTTISLNGEWKVEEGSMDNIPESFNHTVPVPGLISLAVPEFNNAGPKVKDRRSIIQKDSLRDAFWYYRTFNAENTEQAVALLKVSKAMFGTRVYLNDKDLGEHLPCFTPGYFNLKDALKKGENELVIRIGSSRNSVPFSIPDGFDFEKDRYIPGIFDNVELILCEEPHIISVQAAPDIKKKQVRVQVKLDKPANARSSRVRFVVTEALSGEVAGKLSEKISFSSENDGENIVDVTIPLENCRLWSPEDPFLYNLSVATEGDDFQTRFGMREFRYDPVTEMPMLNGKPYFLRGTNVTLYRFFEDDACRDLPWNADWVRDLHKSFKQFNWNSIRYCIGIAPEEWYRIADEEGILIQNEFPIWYGGKGWCVWPDELRSEELVKEFTEWMQEQWNHPSVAIWDASNETVSHNGQTEEIAEAIKAVRSLDLSNRPWDNSYSLVRTQGDVMELHPYHFGNAKFRLKDIANAVISPGGKPEDKGVMKIVNEYGWLWLNRDGTPTTLTSRLYRNLLGADSTEAQRRHLYATYLAAESEFWRCHRQCGGVMHFTALAYSRADGQTSDHFIDVAKLQYEPEFLKYMPDAFSPVGLMLDEWGNDIETGTKHDFRIIAINDLETEWKGKVMLQLLSVNKTDTLRIQDAVIAPYGQSKITINCTAPSLPGIYTVVASLVCEDGKTVKSHREIPFVTPALNRKGLRR